MYWLEFFWQDFRKEQEMYVGVFELAALMEADPMFRKKAQALRATFTRKVRFPLFSRATTYCSNDEKAK